MPRERSARSGAARHATSAKGSPDKRKELKIKEHIFVIFVLKFNFVPGSLISYYIGYLKFILSLNFSDTKISVSNMETKGERTPPGS